MANCIVCPASFRDSIPHVVVARLASTTGDVSRHAWGVRDLAAESGLNAIWQDEAMVIFMSNE